MGILQFDVVAHRLKEEYNVECQFEGVSVYTARWLYSDDSEQIEKFKQKATSGAALDHAGELVYMASSRVNLDMTIDKWPDIEFRNTREQVYN